MLYFLFDNIALETPSADFQGNGSSFNFSLHLYQIRPPSTAGTIFGVTHFIAGNGMFSTNIAYT
jgi:hypothetical protein